MCCVFACAGKRDHRFTHQMPHRDAMLPIILDAMWYLLSDNRMRPATVGPMAVVAFAEPSEASANAVLPAMLWWTFDAVANMMATQRPVEMVLITIEDMKLGICLKLSS